jgi:hypothetical protein
MAALNQNEIGELRSLLAKNTATQTWTKAQFNAAIQAIEDFMQQPSTRNGIGGAIETAAPGVFDVTTKQLAFAIWSITYARRQGVI